MPQSLERLAAPLADGIGAWFSRQSIASKLVVVIAVIATVTNVTAYFVVSGVMTPQFEATERELARTQAERAVAVIGDEATRVRSTARELAIWPLMREYFQGDTGPLLAAISPDMQKYTGSEALILLDADGAVLWQRVIDPVTLQPRPQHLAALRRRVTDLFYFDRVASSEPPPQLVNLHGTIYSLAIASVAGPKGETVGQVLVGTPLKAAVFEKTLRVPVKLAAGAVAGDQRFERGSTTSVDLHPDVVSAAVLLQDHRRQNIGSLDFVMPRTLADTGRHVLWLVFGLVFLVVSALSAVFGRSVYFIVVKRLALLDAHIERSSTDPALGPTRLGEAADEIGRIARRFDDTLSQVRGAQEQMRQQSYLQGKADWASGTMHNLRNAVVPVRVLLGKWLAEEQAAWRRNIEPAMAEVVDTTVPRERRQQLLMFLRATTQRMLRESQQRLGEIGEARLAIEHVTDLLSAENELGHQRIEMEDVPLGEVIFPCAAMAERFGEEPVTVELPATWPVTYSNRVMLTQVIGNAFTNAAEALYAAPNPDKRIVVTLQNSPRDGRFEIRIRDNGEGIDAPVLARIFERGFSTRKNKVGGIGLHWCANTMKRLGGDLSIHSEGRGQGTTLILTLKGELPATAAAA